MAVYPTITCTNPQHIPIHKLTTKRIYDLSIRNMWELPRTFDRTDPNARYWKLIAHLDPAAQRRQISTWAKSIHSKYIPVPWQDTLLKIMLSAFPIGELKGKEGEKHCTHPSCGDTPVFESIEHLFVECPPAAGTIREWFTQ